MDAVAPRARADHHEHVPHAVGGRRDEIALAHQAHAHRVDERVAGVARAKVDFAADRGHADAVAVVADAAHRAGAQVAAARVRELTEAQAVQQRHGPGAHREHVAQNPAHAGRGPLIRLDRGRVVVRFDLEGDGPTLGEPQHTRVLPGPLDHLGSRGRELLQHPLGMFVGAVLAPQRGEDAELGVAGGPPQHRFDAPVFVVREVVLADQGGRDRRIAHRSIALAPDTPRSTAPNTLRNIPCSPCRNSCSASPASSHRPWQWVHWSIWMSCQSPVMRS